MKLSEAIRLGAKKRKQGFGSLFTFFDQAESEYRDIWYLMYSERAAFKKEGLCSCALGAAFEAIKFNNQDLDHENYLPSMIVDSERASETLEKYFPGILHGANFDGSCKSSLPYTAKRNVITYEDDDGYEKSVYGENLYAQIYHLNDTEKLSREKIADILEKEGF